MVVAVEDYRAASSGSLAAVLANDTCVWAVEHRQVSADKTTILGADSTPSV